MKLLVIEDNPILRDRIERQLSRDAVVDLASNGEQGIELANGDYAVILLDLGLPDQPGLSVCRHIRENGIETPILILTAESEITTRVTLLNAGADDYVTKPFHGEELRARVRALARRQPRGLTKEVVTFDGLMLDHEGRKVARDGNPINLTRKEFDILEYLTHNPGRVLTRRMIFDHVWGADAEASDGTVDVHIKRLRDKVDRPFAMPLIQTAHGLGYMVDYPKEVI